MVSAAFGLHMQSSRSFESMHDEHGWRCMFANGLHDLFLGLAGVFLVECYGFDIFVLNHLRVQMYSPSNRYYGGIFM